MCERKLYCVGDLFRVEGRDGYYVLVEISAGYVALIAMGPDARQLRNPVDLVNYARNRIRPGILDRCTNNRPWTWVASGEDVLGMFERADFTRIAKNAEEEREKEREKETTAEGAENAEGKKEPKPVPAPPPPPANETTTKGQPPPDKEGKNPPQSPLVKGGRKRGGPAS